MESIAKTPGKRNLKSEIHGSPRTTNPPTRAQRCGTKISADRTFLLLTPNLATRRIGKAHTRPALKGGARSGVSTFLRPSATQKSASRLLSGTPAPDTVVASAPSRSIRNPSVWGLGVSSEALRASKDPRPGCGQGPSPEPALRAGIYKVSRGPLLLGFEEGTGPAQTSQPRRASPSGACLSSSRGGEP